MSRKDDLINSYGGVNGILSQTPDVKARIRNELLEASRQDAIEANQQADKAAQGSLGNDLAGVAGQVGGVVGGAYLGNQIFNGGSLFGSGAASGAGLTGAGSAVGGASAASAALPAAATGSLPYAAGSAIPAINGGTAAMANIPSSTTGLSSGLQGLGMGANAANIAGQYVVPGIGAAIGGYQIGDALIDGRKMGTVGGALTGAGTGAGIGTMILPGVGTAIGAGVGAIGGAILGQFGHGKNYYAGKNRESVAKSINEKYGPGTLDPELFRRDPGSFTYDLKSPGVNKELGGAQALTALLTGEKSGSKMWGDLSSRFANDIKSGTPVKDLYAKYGLDYNKAMEGIGASSYDTKLKAELQNGLNDAFGQQPRQQSNQGSPGRRPQQQSNSNSSVKKKAKDSSNALSKLWK